MSDNPYATPKSEIDVQTTDDQLQFYVVSGTKFTLLFFITFGFYSVYWFYKNWRYYKISSNSNIWPVPRAIFSIFFTHSLFRAVQGVIQAKNKEFNWNPAGLATTYVVFSILSQVLDRLSMKEIGSPYTDILSLLCLPVIYFALAAAQNAINFSQNDPEGISNSTYTPANYVWFVLGAMLWLLVTIGLMTVFGLPVFE